MPPSSPFDDPDTDDPAANVVDRRGSVYPERGRRPWWRWNVVPLFFVLFVVVWIRTLANWSPAVTWLVVGSIFAMWAILPVLVIPTMWTTMDMLEPDGNRVDQPTSTKFNNAPLVVCKVLAVLFALFSCLHFVVTAIMLIASAAEVFDEFGGRRGAFFFQLQIVTVLVQPLMEFIAAASLYVLAEIGMRLGRS